MKKPLTTGTVRRKKHVVQTEANLEMNKKKALVYNADVTKHSRKSGLHQVIKTMIAHEKKQGKAVVNLKSLTKAEKQKFFRDMRDTLVTGRFAEGIG